jgi:uncharacterized cupredoxin-like copper-binding protein
MRPYKVSRIALAVFLQIIRIRSIVLRSPPARSPPEGHVMRLLRSLSILATLCAAPTAAEAAGNLAGQEPIVVTVELGRPGEHVFVPNKLRFETGKLYKLVLKNPSNDPHYFTSHAFSQMIFTRKVQVTQARDDKTVTLAEVKGAVREVEVYPGQSAEWWFVPIATGRVTDLRCGISGSDGKTHADHGMVGEITIE